MQPQAQCVVPAPGSVSRLVLPLIVQTGTLSTARGVPGHTLGHTQTHYGCLSRQPSLLPGFPCFCYQA